MSSASAEEIGRRVRAARKARGLTQRALATAASVPQPTIVRLERGQHDPTLRLLRALADVLGVDVGGLVCADPP